MQDSHLAIGQLHRIQIGQAMPFAREQTSAINKYQIEHAIVSSTGIAGDEQADPFFHGGPFQAIHHMPQSVYDLIRSQYPKLVVIDGMLGENITITNMQETNVCIGDVYVLGSVKMQVTRPRRPCWKIDSQLNQRGVAKMLLDHGQIGWYYRVLQSGEFRINDSCYLLERPTPHATLQALWHTYHTVFDQHDAQLRYWLESPYLADSFKIALQKRAR